MRAATPYRSIDDDVEEQREDRAALAGTRRNDDDERNDIFDFGTAGKKTLTSGSKTILATLGAVALVGFSAAIGVGGGMLREKVSSSNNNSLFRLGSSSSSSSSRRASSYSYSHSSASSSSSRSRLGAEDGLDDGAPICHKDLRMIIDKLNDASNADDPIKSAIEGDIPNLGVFPSIDPNWERDASAWYHTPAFSGNSGEDGFVMCLPGEWDDSYTYNFDSLFQEGMCIKQVRTDIVNGDFTGCDIRVFSQFAYIFKDDFKQGNVTPRAEDNVFHPPPKLSSDVVDFYYAHESPDHYGYELRGDTEYSQKSLANMQYLAWFNGDPDSNLQSSVWYPFGPSVGSLMRDYKYFTKSMAERIPVVAWMSKDCVQRDRINLLVALSKHFPVFSMGRCEQNIAPPQNDPGRLGDFEMQQELKSRYMFYFALENGVQCPHYMTEKIFDALTRGSIPIYIGWDGVEDYIPSKDAVIDLRDFSSIDKLAAKLAQIATDETEYNKYHAWRHKSPSEWPLKFRNLVRQVSADLKFGICSTLKEGPSKHPPIEPGREATDKCDHSVNIMGIPANQYPGRPAEWWEVLGWKADTAGVEPKVEVADPRQFLTQKCDKMHHAECWDLNMPGLVSYAQALYPHEEEDDEEGNSEVEEAEDEVEKAHESFVDVMEDVVDEVEGAFDGDEEDEDNASSDDSRSSSSERSSSHHHTKHDDDDDDDENNNNNNSGEEVFGMLDQPATTPSDLLLLRKELELLEKENALLTVKEKAAQLGIDV